MARKKDPQLLIDFLNSRQLDVNADYCRRGRRFAGLSDTDLLARWFTVFRARDDAPLDPAFNAETFDITSELDLRHIEPPYDQVQPELDRWLAAVDVTWQACKRDPETGQDMMERMITELWEFEDALIRSN